MTQGTLFDDPRPPKIARVTDPETSHAAAESILRDLPEVQANIMRLLADMQEPCTAVEIGRWAEDCIAGANRDTYRKRPHEMTTGSNPLLIECDKRPCAFSGLMATTFRRAVQ